MVDKRTGWTRLAEGGLTAVISARSRSSRTNGKRGAIVGGIVGLVVVVLWPLIGALPAVAVAVGLAVGAAIGLGLHDRSRDQKPGDPIRVNERENMPP